MPAPDFVNFDYFISWRATGSGDGGWVETNQPATVHPFMISGLIAGTTYDFRVRKRRKTTMFSKYSSSLTATMSATDSSTTTGNVAVYTNLGGGNYSYVTGDVSTTRNASSSTTTFSSANWDYFLLDYTMGASTHKLAVMNSNNPTTLSTEVSNLGYLPGNNQSNNGQPVLTKASNTSVTVNLPGTAGFTVTIVVKGAKTKTATVITFPPLPSS